MSVLPENDRSMWRPAGLAFFFLCSILGLAGRGKAAPVPLRNGTAQSARATSQFAIADFDGDSRPDLATVQVGQSDSSDTRYWILFRLSTGLQQAVGVTAPAGGLQIVSRDVNDDTFLDVVITTAWTNRPVAVLLNDGRGNFTRSDPVAFQGAFRTSQTHWNPIAGDTKDAAAVLFSRHLSGDCEGTSGISFPLVVTGLLVPPPNNHSILFLIASSLGRAPPSTLCPE